MTDPASAGRPADPPAAVAQLTASSDDGRVEVVLDGTRQRSRSLLRDPAAHRDPITTALDPKLAKGEADVLTLTGYRLSRLNEPGDVLVTYVLVLEVPRAGAGPVHALWWENHQEVPTRLWTGEGTLEAVPNGASKLELQLTDADHGDALAVSGLVRVR